MDMRDVILQKLNEIEAKHDVKILLAVESGSRAWGFASPDSDYDVRFVYMHKAAHYISIETKRDVIELPVNEVLDIGGWDIKKALWLFRKTNATLYEWLQSPIIYMADENFHQQMLSMMEEYYLLRPAFHHYISMALNTYNGDLQGSEVRMKKYFYALRPILAAKWIIDRQSVPPMQFSKLRVLVEDSSINTAIDELLEAKKTADEKTTMPPNAVLHTFIKDTIGYCNANKDKLSERDSDTGRLNELFRQMIGV